VECPFEVKIVEDDVLLEGVSIFHTEAKMGDRP
jgi:hypothetical protein